MIRNLAHPRKYDHLRFSSFDAQTEGLVEGRFHGIAPRVLTWDEIIDDEDDIYDSRPRTAGSKNQGLGAVPSHPVGCRLKKDWTMEVVNGKSE